MIVSVSIAVVLCGVLIFCNWSRSNTKYKYELTPNCLLTRHPIVFLSGKKTLLYFGKYWNFIPNFLQDHGYEVMYLDLPWRNSRARKLRLLHFVKSLSDAHLKVHVIGDNSSRDELIYLQKSGGPVIESCWLARSYLKPSKVSVEDLRPDQWNIRELPIVAETPSHSLSKRFWQLLFWGHQKILRTNAPIEPVSLGHPQFSDLSRVGSHYLKFAISLAENDM